PTPVQLSAMPPATPAANCKPPLTSCMPPCTRGCPVQEPTILRPFLKSLHRFVGSSLGGASLGSFEWYVFRGVPVELRPGSSGPCGTHVVTCHDQVVMS